MEVGSSDGLDSLELSRIFPSARVFAFEADPHNYALMVRNIAVRNAITPMPFAVFNFTGQGVFYASGSSNSRNAYPGSGSLLRPSANVFRDLPDITFNEQFNVETVTLLDWSKQNRVGKIDLLWMDTQGAELQILIGMGELIRTARVIILEVWQAENHYEQGASFEEIKRFLESYGFHLNATWMDQGVGDALFRKG